jgi:hypothetical protein
MEYVFWRGESQEVVRTMVIARLKMEDAYNFCNVIEIFCWKK